MNKSRFIQRMKKDRKSESTIKRNIEFTEVFERYLLKEQKRKIDKALPKDLEDFKIWGEEKKLRNVRMYFMSLWAYYEFLNKEEMVFKAKEIMGTIELSAYRLKDFQGVSRKNIKNLEKNGVKTAKQILDIGYTKKGRDKLTKETDVPVESVLELVKLSDLARIPGVKKIRARLYYEAGLDTLQKIAACDSEELRKKSANCIKKTGFKGIPPTPKEAQHTVDMAKYLKKYVEY